MGGDGVIFQPSMLRDMTDPHSLPKCSRQGHPVETALRATNYCLSWIPRWLGKTLESHMNMKVCSLLWNFFGHSLGSLFVMKEGIGLTHLEGKNVLCNLVHVVPYALKQ